jgi:hypothetical protein
MSPRAFGIRTAPAKTFIREFERTGNALAAFNEAIESGIRLMLADMEAQLSDEYVRDTCEANGYLFTERGVLA